MVIPDWITSMPSCRPSVTGWLRKNWKRRISNSQVENPCCHSPGAVEVESVGTDVDDAIEAFFEPSPRLSQHGWIGRDHVMVGIRASGVGIDREVGDQLGREDERLVGA